MKYAPVLVVLARMSAGHAAGAADIAEASAITPTILVPDQLFQSTQMLPGAQEIPDDEQCRASSLQAPRQY